jgi:hypothetical protein
MPRATGSCAVRVCSQSAVICCYTGAIPNSPEWKVNHAKAMAADSAAKAATADAKMAAKK